MLFVANRVGMIFDEKAAGAWGTYKEGHLYSISSSLYDQFLSY